MKIPLLDLKAQFESIRNEVVPALMSVVESQQFIMGEAVGKLEAEVARLSHARFGIGCASGTDALLLALKALNLRPGDEVITTTFTFFATAGAIHNAGGRPVFVDINPETFNFDLNQVEDAINNGRKEYDFMQGNEEYKYRFGGKDTLVFRLTVER